MAAQCQRFSNSLVSFEYSTLNSTGGVPNANPRTRVAQTSLKYAR
jgi:hypothetical protein